jgi:hypothetical protein
MHRRIPNEQKIFIGFNGLLLPVPIQLLHVALPGQCHEHLGGDDERQGGRVVNHTSQKHNP